MSIMSFLLLETLSFAPVAQPSKPNILVFLVDDFGWANVGTHSDSAQVHTPNMDRLQAEGIELDRYYSYKICGPSRVALQSGRLPGHVADTNTGVLTANLNDPIGGYVGVPRNMTGFAEKLRDVGYRTHFVGKWDAGMATPRHTPEGRGYETAYGFYQHANKYWTKGMELNSSGAALAATGEIDEAFNEYIDFFESNSTYHGGVLDQEALTWLCEGMCSTAGVPGYEDFEKPCAVKAACYKEELFLARSLKILDEHDPSEPILLFHSFGTIHTPLEVPGYYVDMIYAKAFAAGEPFESANQLKYAAMVAITDRIVGDLTDAFKNKGIYDNTVIMLTSDNGGPVYVPGSANNYPLKGGKYSDWEGGLRVMAFLSGGYIPQANRGTTFSGVISVADWYATFCELAGISEEEMTDKAAIEANVWIRAYNAAGPTSPILELPPIDSRPQWKAIINGEKIRTDAFWISPKAVMKFPYKLVTEDQPYSMWFGKYYPNCTSVHDMNDTSKGYPSFVDMKIFDKRVNFPDASTFTVNCSATSAGACLFNVLEDPTEHHNLADEMPELVAELMTNLKEMQKNHYKRDLGEGQRVAVMTPVFNGKFYGPFLQTDDVHSPTMDFTAGGYYSPNTSVTQSPESILTAAQRVSCAMTLTSEGFKTLMFKLVNVTNTVLASPYGVHKVSDMFGNLDQCLATENIEIDLKEIFDPKMPPKGPAAGLGPPPIAKQMMDKFKTEPNTIDQLDKLHTEIGSAVRAMRKMDCVNLANTLEPER